MSAEKLREAARLMRERAEAAKGSPWEFSEEPGRLMSEWAIFSAAAGHDFAMCESDDDAEHIASWHPAVALAVADSLEEAADAFDRHMEKQMDPLRRFHGLWLAEAERKHERALAIARAYLNEATS